MVNSLQSIPRPAGRRKSSARPRSRRRSSWLVEGLEPRTLLTTAAPVSVTGQGYLLFATEGIATGPQTLAVFTDPANPGGGPVAPGTYTVSVNWGDSTPLDTATPTIVPGPNGTYSVQASHNYHEETPQGAPANVTVTIGHGTATPATATDSEIVSDAPLVLPSTTAFSAVEGVPFNGVVATFQDSSPFGTAADFTASITWGDGHTGPGTVAPDGHGGFTVSGNNIYAALGSLTYSVLIKDQGGAIAQPSGFVTVGPIVVTRADDPTSTHTGVSLRDAVNLANADASINNVTYHHDIAFAASLTGPITLGTGSGPLLLGSGITLTGQGTGDGAVTIAGDDQGRAFEVAVGQTVVFKAMKVNGSITFDGAPTAVPVAVTTTSITQGTTSLTDSASALKSVDLALGAGDDGVSITGLFPGGVTTVDGGAGNNTVTANFPGDFVDGLTLIKIADASITVGHDYSGQLLDIADPTKPPMADSGVINSITVGHNWTATGSVIANEAHVVTTLLDAQNQPVIVNGQPITYLAPVPNTGIIHTITIGSVGAFIDNYGNFCGYIETGHIDTLTIYGTSKHGSQVYVHGDGTIDDVNIDGDLDGTIVAPEDDLPPDPEAPLDPPGPDEDTGIIGDITVGGDIGPSDVTGTDPSDPVTVDNPPDDPNIDTGQLVDVDVDGDMNGGIEAQGAGHLTKLVVHGTINGRVLAHDKKHPNDPTLGVIGSVTFSTLGTSGTITSNVIQSLDGDTLSGKVQANGEIDSLVLKLLSGIVTTGQLGTTQVGTLGSGSTLTFTDAPSLHYTTIEAGSTIKAGSIGTLTVDQDLAGLVQVDGALKTLVVGGATPGSVAAGQIGTIAAAAGTGPVVAQIEEGGIVHRIEVSVPTAPSVNTPQVAAASPAGVTFAYLYEGLISPSVEVAAGAANLPNPQATIHVANTSGNTTPDQFDLSLVVYSDTAKFNLARLDSAGGGVSGIGNVAVEGDILSRISATPAGVYLPLDRLAGVGVRDFAPARSITAKSIQGVAFGSTTGPKGLVETGWAASPSDAAALLVPGTAIVQAGSTNGTAKETFRVPFADLPTQQVAVFLNTEAAPGHFDNATIEFSVQGVSNGLTTQPSNVPRGAVTALITVAQTFDKKSKPQDSVVQRIDLFGDGGSISSQQFIAQAITSTGPLGDITDLSGQGINNITAPSIFGNLSTGGSYFGLVQTTGVRTDPITGAQSLVPADLGRAYVVTPTKKGAQPYVTATTIQGNVTGAIVSRGSLVSTLSTGGGVIAAQGNIGAFSTLLGAPVRVGGVSANGGFSGAIVALGDIIGDIAINGGLKGGFIAARGSIRGNVSINGGLDSTSVIVAGGAIGDPTLGTSLNINGNNKGIIAAKGTITATGKPGGSFFSKAAGTPNATAIDMVFAPAGDPPDISNPKLGNVLIQIAKLSVDRSGKLTD